MFDKSFDLSDMNILSLAHLGDAVYELLARQYVLINNINKNAYQMHKGTTKIVCASSQAKAYDIVQPVLDETEMQMMKRGRNSNTSKIPKNADCIEYRKATGMEALFGYLYLNGNTNRLKELFQIIIDNLTVGD